MDLTFKRELDSFCGAPAWKTTCYRPDGLGFAKYTLVTAAAEDPQWEERDRAQLRRAAELTVPGGA